MPATDVVRERRVIDGVGLDLAWLEPAGAAAAPTLVFLHEGLGCVATWHDFPARLATATGCRALVGSRAGYGDSDPVALPRPLTYMHHEGRVALPALLDATGIDDAIAFGHSDGASIALIHAATDHGRARMRGLVLEAPHVFCEDRSVAAIARARDEYLHGDLRARLARHHGANVDVAFRGWNGAWLDPGFRAWNLEDLLPAVRCPVLVIQCDDDPYGTLRQVEAIAAGCGGPVTRLVLPGASHAPHRAHPDATLAAAADFIRARCAGA